MRLRASLVLAARSEKASKQGPPVSVTIADTRHAQLKCASMRIAEHEHAIVR
jgi:hypothetical protein